ncbi:MAG TPA: Hpt domain-containing protein [Acidobacteriaceae bacterium]|nr:Hpt domain-containing protein [Acidobacteriaceae bacterium]
MNEKDRTAPESAASDPQSQEQKLQEMIASLWDRSRHTVVERAATLRAAGDLLVDNRLDAATQLNAVDCAHKLAGVLGTFGLPRGTDLAREAEIFFGRSATPSKVEIDRLRALLAELTRIIDLGPAGPA